MSVILGPFEAPEFMDSFLVIALEVVPGGGSIKAVSGTHKPRASLPSLLSLRSSVNTLQPRDMPVASATIFKV